jgi:archaeal type IV pilus assembly protein PilA
MMHIQRKTRDEGVSPVVGVMLMLVVTIIIAAVVSAYAGGLTAGEKKAPSASVEVHLKNDGTGNTYMLWKVLSVSEGIPTKDLKITTSWVNSSGGKGGATILPGGNNTIYRSYPSAKWSNANAPGGVSGPGVTGSSTNFGNYTWVSGTVMENWPPNYGAPVIGTTAMGVGATPYNYWPLWTDYICAGGTEVDSFTAMLGCQWNTLRPGDVITVKVIHVPTGKVIVNQPVTVEG